LRVGACRKGLSHLSRRITPVRRVESMLSGSRGKPLDA
jgi:hypothetical protein